MDRLNDFFEETWRFYRRPLTQKTKSIVRRYDKYLLNKGLIKEDQKLKLDGKVIILPSYPPPPVKNPVFREPKDIAFIHEDVGHITGGRYYAYFIISALLELGHKVTIYSNRKAVFTHEFDEYKKPQFKIVSKTASQLATAKIPKADVYIGSPIHGGVCAIKHAKKYNKPVYVLVFDPFPMMDKFIGKREYVGWTYLIKGLKEKNTNVISLCNETSKYVFDWLGKGKEQVYPLYPCINSIVLDQVGNFKRQKYALFISRLVKHKKFQDCVKACKENNIKLKVIASVNGIGAQKIVKELEAESIVEFHLRVDDKTKFEMIKKASVVINGSIFEGFGMFVAEAIACGTPFVGYDYPTFREIRDYSKADNIYLAKFGDSNDLSNKLKQAIEEKKFLEPSKEFHFEKMVDRLKDI
ncbi:MAG: UDP-D-galactose:(glucosyl)lipopolysaccharide-1,6-D-galactosyltransferase [bacterium ADurb.Bin212]|nr:MAG: UDP-D-galactose:(glucosyl)lipopolysaccharide-1,6-D-galactosyltransferase [bacterium ADurb.Bin212]